MFAVLVLVYRHLLKKSPISCQKQNRLKLDGFALIMSFSTADAHADGGTFFVLPFFLSFLDRHAFIFIHSEEVF